MNPDVFSPAQFPEPLTRYFRRAMVTYNTDAIDMSTQVRGTGYCYLGWTPSGRWQGIVNTNEHSFDTETDGQVHLSGQVLDGVVTVRFSGVLQQIFLEFTALGQYEFLGLPGIDTFERAMDPTDLLPADFKSNLTNSFTSAEDLAQTFFGAALTVTPAKEAPAYLHDLVQAIEDAHGDVRFSELVGKIGISERKARDDFSRIVGLGPKQFSKLLQVNHAFGALMSLGEKRLAELALECGFSDQAHMTRTFGEFLGDSPVRFAENVEPTLKQFVGFSRKVNNLVDSAE
ncbi:MAG: helix-turn-helix domain-containing protein [Paracoccaceae bacterium]